MSYNNLNCEELKRGNVIHYYENENDCKNDMLNNNNQSQSCCNSITNKESIVNVNKGCCNSITNKESIVNVNKGCCNSTTNKESIVNVNNQSQSCCGATESKQVLSNSSSGCCGNNNERRYFKRFPKNAPFPKNNQQNSYSYMSSALRAVTLPMGPIGGGSIDLAGDGGLRQWQICNRVNHLGHVPHSFFAFKLKSQTYSKSMILMSNENYDQSGFVPAPMITDAEVPKESIALLKKYPSIEKLSMNVTFPSATIDYVSGETEIKIQQTVFSPFIPLDSKNSNIPVIFFEFVCENTTNSDLTCSLLNSQQNFVGWDGESSISGTSNGFYGNNVNQMLSSTNYQAIKMINQNLRSTDAQNGEVMIAVIDVENAKTTNSYLCQFNDLDILWKQFTSQETLDGQGISGSSSSGNTFDGAIESTFDLAAGETKTIVFALIWSFPNRYVSWNQAGFGIKDTKSSFWLGNNYNNNWKDTTDVLNYCITNYNYLKTNTFAFRDNMFSSTLPWQLIESAAGRLSVLRSPTCMWIIGDSANKHGVFIAFEGCSTNDGCCPLNCTHVWNYEQALAQLFPDLEQTMRTVDLLYQLSPNSILPSRTTVPLDLKRQWNDWPDYTQVDPASTAICVDGEIGVILKTYREIRNGADQAWFNTVYPKCVNIINRWMNDLDSSGDGVIYQVPQPNTYDCSIYSANLFMGTYYMCALKAMNQMALIQGDSELATKCLDRFKLSSTNYDKKCYNGEYYIAIEDPTHPVEALSTCTFVDTLIGQWWAIQLDLGLLLPEDHIISTLKMIRSRNYRKSFELDEQYPRKFFDSRDSGMFIGDWGTEPIPKNAMLYTREGAWSGITYAYVGLCFYFGLNDIAIDTLTDIRARQDGTRRSPWNEIECGDHYTRPMSAWALFDIYSGVCWDSVNGMLTLTNGSLATSSLLVLGSGWGNVIQTSTSSIIKCDFGTYQLSSVKINKLITSSITAKLGTTILSASVKQYNTYTTIVFNKVITVTPTTGTLTLTY